MNRILPVLAVIVPCFNESLNIHSTSKRLRLVLNKLVNENVIDLRSFILFVDDGSSDNTWKYIHVETLQQDRVVGIKLSRNYGHQNALIAGMEFVLHKCDCLITIDADLQQDENRIEEFLFMFKSGYEVILGIREDRVSDSAFKRYTAEFFYLLIRILGVDVVRNHADYRLLSNAANLALCTYSETNLFLRVGLPE
jgi:polyisoprenyl-phosphate glycosyltransferase